jgi:hypothetical protein
MSFLTKPRRIAHKNLQRILPVSNSGGADRGTQLLLAREWARLYREGDLLQLRDVEFRNNSQNGEDGTLLYLMTLAGHGSRRAIELCAGDGIQNNTANLVLHHDWDVLMIDGDLSLIERGRQYYSEHPETFRIGPTLVAEWVTTENVNNILGRHGYQHDIDLLSLDMDGVDYWILDALDIRPRVMVLEYNNRIPTHLALTVPNRSSFKAEGGAWAGDGFFGASLAAFNHLLTDRGYRLVGANRHNTNAYFLRNDVLIDMPAALVADCQTSRWARHQVANWGLLADRPWVRVE